jgi:hypothetical protein
MAGVQLMMMIMAMQLGTPSARYDEHSSKFFPSVRNQGLSFEKEKANTTEVMLASFVTASDNL